MSGRPLSMPAGREGRRWDLEGGTEQVAELQRHANAGRLAAALAHDMRNALACVKSNLEFALEMGESGRADPLQLVESLREGLAALGRAIATASSLFGLAQRPPLSGGHVDAGELTRCALSVVEPLLRGRTVDVELQPGCLVAADRDALLQALVHLLLETGEAKGPGAVRVQVAAADGEVRIVIAGVDPGDGVKLATLRVLVCASGGELIERPYGAELRFLAM